MAVTGTMTPSGQSSYGELTKGADGDTSATIAHGLGVIPEGAIITPVSGTEGSWKITGMTTANITLSLSNTAGTAASVARLLAWSRHSIR